MAFNLNFQESESMISDISGAQDSFRASNSVAVSSNANTIDISGISPLKRRESPTRNKMSPLIKKNSPFSKKNSPKRQKLRSPKIRHNREGSSNFKWSTDCKELLVKASYSHNCHLRVQGKTDEMKWTAVGDSLWTEEDFYVQGDQLSWSTLKNSFSKIMKEFTVEFSLGMIYL